jgi:hypothetical protein
VTPGCKNLFLYDCNPGSPLHWAYKEFILKISFLTGEKLIDPDLYAALRMNPVDNQKNLPENYVSDILGNLPEKQRARFRDGVWVIPEGAIYGRFEDSICLRKHLTKSFMPAAGSVTTCRFIATHPVAKGYRKLPAA